MDHDPHDPELCAALRNAADQLEGHAPRRSAVVGAVPGIPAWLLTILQLLGPPVLEAVQAWLATILPPKVA